MSTRPALIGHFARALAAIVSLCICTNAHAQRGIDVETFHPAMDGFGIFTVERAETGKQWDVGFRAFTDYAASPLTLHMKDATGMAADRSMMDYQWAIHLGIHVSIADWLELALVLPMYSVGFTDAYGSRDTPLKPTGFFAADPLTNVGPTNASPGDVRAAIKARTPRVGPLGLALLVTATIPFGDDASFMGDTGFTLRPTLIADLTFLRGFTAAINVGYIWRQRTTVYDPYDVVAARTDPTIKPAVLLDLGDEITASLGLAVRVASWIGIGGELYALLPQAGGVTSPDTTADAILGLNLFPTRSVQLTLGGGIGVLTAHRQDHGRAFFGLTWLPADGARSVGLGSGDADGDGIPDAKDQCPNEPEDKDGFQDEDGCPDPDNDGDGIADAKDKCPNEPEDKDGFQDDDGCPEPDNDGDGIPDTIDKCPNEAEDKDGFQDDDGCPELDNDGDGIPDSADKCPNEPETMNGIDDDDGCPDVIPGAKS